MAHDDATAQGESDDQSLIERAAARLAERRSPLRRQGVARAAADDEPGNDSLEIDLLKLGEAGYLTPSTMRSGLAEEMRLIKRSVVQTFWFQEVERANLIMVTSAFPKEGKSFVALNLAMSLAWEVDFRVLLVDADFHRPVVFDRLGLSRHRGLMDVLREPDGDIGSVIMRTNIERLSVIGPGRSHETSTELLASHRMAELTGEIADRYPDRLVIFDTPPLLASSEPSTLAEHMGQVIYVVEADATSKDVVRHALSLLPKDIRVGLVLNKSRAGTGGSDFSYYGYKGYYEKR